MKRSQTIRALERCIEACARSAHGWAILGDSKRAEERAAFVRALEATLVAMGGSTVSNRELIVAPCEGAAALERQTLRDYEDAVRDVYYGLPARLRAVFDGPYDAIKLSLEGIAIPRAA